MSFIVTSMGRLEHIKQTLPSLINQPDSEYILVDWSCPEGSGNWTKSHFPKAKVINVKHEKYFNPSGARNTGAYHAGGKMCCFFDVDVIVDPNFSTLVAPFLNEKEFIIAEDRNKGLGGFLICPRWTFDFIRYNEQLGVNYGREDTDIVLALVQLGLQGKRLRNSLFHLIPHDNHLRMQFKPIKEIDRNFAVSDEKLLSKWNMSIEEIKALFKSYPLLPI